jgi:hypothetical protein
MPLILRERRLSGLSLSAMMFPVWLLSGHCVLRPEVFPSRLPKMTKPVARMIALVRAQPPFLVLPPRLHPAREPHLDMDRLCTSNGASKYPTSVNARLGGA